VVYKSWDHEVLKSRRNPSCWLQRGYVVTDWRVRKVELRKCCVEKKVNFCEVAKSEEIWTIKSRENT
jgi:hypothetical protein